jgi:pentatricopeptide repeat protein
MSGLGLQPNVITMNAAISACEKGGQWKKALALLDSMPDLGLQPNVITMNAAISACEKSGQWEKALAILDSMPDLGLQPDVITMNAAISACEKGGQWEKALALLDSMPGLGLQPDVITMKAVIEALDKGVQFDRAISVIDAGRFSGLFGHVWVSDEQVDLHDCSAAVARSVIGCLLRDLNAGKRGVCNITVITGRGNRSDGEAVLLNVMRAFLSSISGPAPCEVPRNPGRFVLTKSSIQMWIQRSRK